MIAKIDFFHVFRIADDGNDDVRRRSDGSRRVKPLAAFGNEGIGLAFRTRINVDREAGFFRLRIMPVPMTPVPMKPIVVVFIDNTSNMYACSYYSINSFNINMGDGNLWPTGILTKRVPFCYTNSVIK